MNRFWNIATSLLGIILLSATLVTQLVPQDLFDDSIVLEECDKPFENSEEQKEVDQEEEEKFLEDASMAIGHTLINLNKAHSSLDMAPIAVCSDIHVPPPEVA